MDRLPSFASASPTGTPYRTPSSSLSRRSREFEDMSPSSTPPPLPADARIAKKRSSESQKALDDGISPLDPRRFTPTLHASLVSEILSLRRDLESKTKSLDQLEQNLDAAQSQNESLNKSLLASNKEVRLVKRQMQLLEGGTLSAINDLSKERDEAVHESIDLRKRLEQSQRRVKTSEENAERAQKTWEIERESWASDKRTLETKAHVAEGRLKRLLGEFAEAQSQSMAMPVGEATQRPSSRMTVPGSPVNGFGQEDRDRRQSIASNNSDHQGGRMSSMSFANDASTTLADELALDDIEESIDDEESVNGNASPDALPEERERPMSSLSIKARRVLGLPFDFEQLENSEKSQSATEQDRGQSSVPQGTGTVSYVDAATQYLQTDSPMNSTKSDDTFDVTQSNSNAADTSRTAVVAEDLPFMISTSCQTVEYLPSPPLTPEKNDYGLATIHESAYEKAETREISTQTNLQPRPTSTYRYVHSRTSTHDLGVPTITIIPPTSRPATPENIVVLPPQTKNASCQAEFSLLCNYTTSSMQTEDIRIDKRDILSYSVPDTPPTSQLQAKASKGKASTHNRHGLPQTIQPVSNSSLKRSPPHDLPVPPVNDSGPLGADSLASQPRPIRSSSLFAGFDDLIDNAEDDLDNDIFYEDEFSTRPTAKFTLKAGKLVSQESTLEDIGELTAASAGEALALDNLRKSETVLPPELRQIESAERSKDLKRQSTVRRAPSSSKQTNVRRAAIISNGVAAHQSKHSESTVESGSNDGGMPPPIPIPLRYSSARINKSFSEGGRNSRGSSSNASPTRQYRHKYRPALRKARSGPALSPASQIRRPRSKSPPLDSRVSIVPEMPHFEMPTQSTTALPMGLTNDYATSPYEASAPRPSVATGPGRGHGHIKQVSDAGLLQQTSVVDAIAQTMVGEWMYKYVRRRKSFGKPDKDWDPNRSVEELTSSSANAGVRHKRWVWLAPYERAIMWSSKQPMNGTALLGKSGRKLTVKSVLDVKDDNPMPKNSLTGAVFNRSILILTPQRALKFTATSQERHFVWLTALSFLSHSPLSIGDLAALPPPPDEFRSPSPPPQPLGGSFRRRTIRDSIRIAKGPHRQEGGQRSITTDGSIPPTEHNDTRPPTRDFYDHESDAALPPTIRRFHTRNRSNTAPRPVASSFLSFPRETTSTVPQPSTFFNHFNHEQIVSEKGQFSPSLGNPSVPNSRRGSEASAFGRPNFSNAYTNHGQPSTFTFSDSSHNASMTMRMDAFIDNKQAGRGNFRNLRLGGSSRAANKDPGFWGVEEAPSTISPVESVTPANTSMRLSESTGRASVERDFFRGF